MKKIGVIGFGVVGKSVVDTLLVYQDALQLFLKISDQLMLFVWDQQQIALEVQKKYELLGVCFVSGASDLAHFIDGVDYVIASPGVDMRKYSSMSNKFIEEVDLFSALFKKTIVAITGSLGKTSVTKLIVQLIELSQLTQEVFADRIVPMAAGNIGNAMLSLLDQGDVNCAVLELSSFQLDRAQTFAPHIAVMTNIYENHLDRHGSLQAYAQAKGRMFEYQRSCDIAIVHEQCLVNEEIIKLLNNSEARLIIVAPSLASTAFGLNKKNLEVICVEEGMLVAAIFQDGVLKEKKILAECRRDELLAVTFIDNWLLAVSVLYAMKLNVLQVLASVYASQEFAIEEHCYRVEKFLSVGDVDFYDDSKSTVLQATLAAVHKLAVLSRPIILILGGKSKGVDRSGLMSALNNFPQLKKVYCFGAECALFEGCHAFSTLEEVMDDLLTLALPGDIVLFSPSGASFDFFKNYQHRGDVFKALARKLFQK